MTDESAVQSEAGELLRLSCDSCLERSGGRSGGHCEGGESSRSSRETLLGTGAEIEEGSKNDELAMNNGME